MYSVKLGTFNGGRRKGHIRFVSIKEDIYQHIYQYCTIAAYGKNKSVFTVANQKTESFLVGRKKKYCLLHNSNFQRNKKKGLFKKH